MTLERPMFPPVSSRRGFLAQAAVVAAGGTAVGMALPLPVSAGSAERVPDPIYAAIEIHKAAVLVSTNMQRQFSDFEDELYQNNRLQYEYRNDEEGRRGRALEAARDAAYDAETEAAHAMLNIRVTTLAGVAALLTYTRDHDESNYGMGWPEVYVEEDSRTWQAVLLSKLADILPELAQEAV